MKKTVKRTYTSPCIKVFTLHAEQLLQTVSVTPNTQESVSDNGEYHEYDGGIGFIGDGSDVAPAKKSGGLWSDDSDED